MALLYRSIEKCIAATLIQRPLKNVDFSQQRVQVCDAEDHDCRCVDQSVALLATDSTHNPLTLRH